MTVFPELDKYDATGLAELVKKHQVKPEELIDETIDRIEKLNPVLNVISLKMYEHAKDLAGNVDMSAPFAGVPFLLKDFLAEYAGFPLTWCSKFVGNFIPDVDSELVKRFRSAGFITVAKTISPEFAIGASTEPVLFGPVHNPWNLDRTSGGSSGGAAAAIASGIVPVAHGNDWGGSIRIPASACGLFGMKPTRGRNPLGPYFGDINNGLVAEHVLTRSVRDSAGVLDATSGSDIGDPYPCPISVDSFEAESRRQPDRLRIGFSVESPLGTPVHKDCITAVKSAMDLCEDLGHVVEEASPSFDGEMLWSNYTNMCAAGVSWAADTWSKRLNKSLNKDEFEPFIWDLIQRGRTITAPEYLMYNQTLQIIYREMAAFYETYDVWVTSTLGEPPIVLGSLAYDGSGPIAQRRKQATFSPYTYISNVTGQPSMTVPLHWNSEDLPIGVHFTAGYGNEGLLFRLARQLELAAPWWDRRPPIYA